jgi:cytidyltransferase-like protein
LTRAYCGGTFDLLHPGHVRFFEWASQSFDEVFVAVNRDEFCARYKRPPVQCLYERLEMVQSCRYVTEAIVNTGDEDSKPAILETRPTHVVNGSDWSRERLMEQMGLTQLFLDWTGIEIVLCPLPRQFSTTELKQRIKNA